MCFERFSSNLNKISLITGLFLVALVVRVVYITYQGEFYALSSDGVLYSNMAENFLQGHGLINTVRDKVYVVGPVYPLFLALVFAICGVQNFSAVVVTQAVISSATTVLACYTGHKLGGKVCAGLVFVLVCFYPPFLYWNRYILSEPLYTFTITLMLYILLLYSQELRNKKHFKYAICLGLVLGFSILIRPILLPVLPVLLIWFLFVNKGQWKTSLRDFAVISLMIVLTLTPWWIRNFVRYHQFIAVSNYGGYELYCGNNPYTDTRHVFEPETYITFDQKVVDQVSRLPVDQQDQKYSMLAKKYILEHPWLFITRTLAKAFNVFWAPMAGKDLIVLVLGGLGAIICLGLFRQTGFLLLIIACYSLTISAITVVPTGRYREPIMPAVIMLGALFLTWVYQKVKRLVKGA